MCKTLGSSPQHMEAHGRRSPSRCGPHRVPSTKGCHQKNSARQQETSLAAALDQDTKSSHWETLELAGDSKHIRRSGNTLPQRDPPRTRTEYPTAKQTLCDSGDSADNPLLKPQTQEAKTKLDKLKAFGRGNSMQMQPPDWAGNACQTQVWLISKPSEEFR